MIEWVDIKDWESDGKEAYLALIDLDNPLNRVVVLATTYTHIPGTQLEWCGRRVTHAAKINFPKEKTLEEKFSEWYGYHTLKWKDDPDLCINRLAEIAKQHYEK